MCGSVDPSKKVCHRTIQYKYLNSKIQKEVLKYKNFRNLNLKNKITKLRWAQQPRVSRLWTLGKSTYNNFKQQLEV